MTTAPAISAARQRDRLPVARAIVSPPLVIALLLTLTLTALRLTGTVDSDVAWQLWIAARIHHGANLYSDIIETNPPLWFWMALPIDRLSELLQVRVEAVLVAAIGIATSLALFATNHLLLRLTPARRALFLSCGAVTLLGIPWVHVGQREQIVMIGTLPYAALIAARRRGDPVPHNLAALIGVGAAIGFALKHYFLLVPALLELWLFAANRRNWSLLRPETAAIVLVGASYAGAIVGFEPDYITRIVPLVRLAYAGFGAPDISYLFGPSAVLGVVMLTVLACHWRRLLGPGVPLASALAIATLAFAVIYFIQFKGWTYHAIPLLVSGCLAIAALLVESDTAPPSLRLLFPALFLVPLALTITEAMHPVLPSRDLEDALVDMKRGDTVGFVATETAIPWSVTLQRGFRYPSRYNGYWMLPAIVHDEASGAQNPRLRALGKQIVSDTVADFTCTPPQRIIIARPHPSDRAFDILPFFERDPSFRQLMSHYRARSWTSLQVFDRISPIGPPPGHCRNGI